MKRAVFVIASTALIAEKGNGINLNEETLNLAQTEAGAEAEFIKELLQKMFGGDKMPKAKINGIKINAIDANQHSACHGGEFKGETKGNSQGND